MTALVALAPGQIFAGDFLVVRQLAAGGMGVVYVVEQLSTGKQRALKLMLPNESLADAERRFIQEARACSLVESEHVVEVIAAGIDPQTKAPWIAMELLKGVPLGEYVTTQGALGLNETYAVMEQLCHALSRAHDIPLVHRDLKPENIFLAESRTVHAPFRVKVLDFGLAKLTQDVSQNTMAMGSPLWMAPEQTQAEARISCATDVWALGLIAFYLLTGRYYWLTPHHDAEFRLAPLLREIVLDELPVASHRAASLGGGALPTGFDAWFGRCVQRDPEARYPNANVLWEEFSRMFAPLLAAAPGAAMAPSQRAMGSVLSTEAAGRGTPAEVPTKVSEGAPREVDETAEAAPTQLSAGATIAAPPKERRNRRPLLFATLGVVVAGAVLVWMLGAADEEAPPASAPLAPGVVQATRPGDVTSGSADAPGTPTGAQAVEESPSDIPQPTAVGSPSDSSGARANDSDPHPSADSTAAPVDPNGLVEPTPAQSGTTRRTAASAGSSAPAKRSTTGADSSPPSAPTPALSKSSKVPSGVPDLL